MYKLVFFFLFIGFPNFGKALIPIEGVIYGEIKDIRQYDPFVGMLTQNFFSTKKFPREHEKLIYYTALYKQGSSLEQECESLHKVSYANLWQEETARRSLIANLQYIGLDLTLKAIVNYGKKFEFSDEKFTMLYENLVRNTCSQNLSVYSQRFLKSNFKHYWKNGVTSIIPTISSSPFFNDELKRAHDTYDVSEREFEYTLQNFRDFCSWDSDAENLNLLLPYLKNPHIMSFVFNNLNQKSLNIDIKTHETYLEDSDKGVQVACENMICRKRSRVDFKKYFPRMHGSSSFSDDLKVLYCTHFKKSRKRAVILSKTISKWSEEQTVALKNNLALNFLGLITGYPNVATMAEKNTDIVSFFKSNIKKRWDDWAELKTNQFNTEQLYEESLEVSLESQKNTSAVELGNFNIKFHVDLGEMDKLLDGHDKIASQFFLEFSAQYIRTLYERMPFLYNSGRYIELERFQQSLVETVSHQLEKKKRYFKVPIWNEKMATLISDELIEQVRMLHKTKRSLLKKGVIKIPVKFHFGVFALQYIRKKYLFEDKANKKISFN